MPAGTLLANMLACAAAFVCTSPAACPHIPAAVSTPLIIGALGSLSTVSTWAEEVRCRRRRAAGGADSLL